MGKIMIDWTISVGSMLQIAAFLIAGVGAFFAVRADIRVLRHDVKSVQLVQDHQAETLANISSTLTTVAVQGERINQLSQQITEMRHGQGFVNPMRS